jgi:hypothetical protein
VKTLELSKGYIAVVDSNDPKKPWMFKWHARVAYRPDGLVRTVYAQRWTYEKGKRRVLQLHRFLLGVSNPAIEIDHLDGNGLNNRRKNLRKATTAQNKHNRKDQDGVFWDTYRNKWVAAIKYNGKRKFLGRFTRKEDALLARKKAATLYHKEFARRVA